MLACCLLSLLGTVHAAIVNDAYRYDDNFNDNNGIDASTTGFANLGGSQVAKNKTNTLVSSCFSLPPPVNGAFDGWSFAEVVIDNLDLVQTNSLHVESCDGTIDYLTVNPVVGTNAFDLSSNIPASTVKIRLRWQVTYQGNGGLRTAAISNWRVLGTASGVTQLMISPSTTAARSNSDITFTLGLTSVSATTANPVLHIDLNAINGTPDAGIAGVGLATDATVCYDTNSDTVAGQPASECKRYRPLELVSAGNGTSGEPPDLSGLSQPAQQPVTNGMTDGVIRWQLQNLPDGYSGSIAINLHIPKGYIDGKTVAIAATLDFGEHSADGAFNNLQSVSSQSPAVSVASDASAYLRQWSPIGNIAPGVENIYDNFYVRNSADQNSHPSDYENIEVVVQAPASSTCVPTFRSATQHIRYGWPAKISKPAVGAPMDTNALTVTFFRASYVNDSSNARVRVYSDAPATCADGTRVRMRATGTADSPAMSSTSTLTHNVVFEACRSGYNHLHRAQSGLLVSNDYAPWPAWPEYYINNGSVRPGEYISTWSPYGDSSYRTHTIVLDKSYAIIDVPPSVTFHGYRTRRKEDTDSSIVFFKDPLGTAPLPTDAAFNNNFDPALENPAPGWYPVEQSWSGPFDSYTGTSADDTNDRAVLGPSTRLLVVKTNDNTSSGASDYGLLRTQAVWRVCDGSFGCAAPADGTQLTVTGTTFTYQQIQTPHARQCVSMNGYRTYVESKSFPRVYSWAEQQNVQAGGVASVILNPHNSNAASQYVDGKWSFDLSNIADNIDLDNITGEVLTSGLNLPAANQNIPGQSCQLNDIQFRAPGTAHPIAYWEVPPRCQLPNGWGYQLGNNTAQDNYTQSYRFKLNVPVKATTAAGTVLDFQAQIRRNDLSATGADNAVNTSRWNAGNYQAITPITVLETPSATATKSGPSGWPINATFSYGISVANKGNTPLYGYYLVDRLPRTGVNGSEFTPLYGSVYIDLPPGQAVLETSVASTCHSDPLNTTWIPVSLIASSRSGFQSESAALASDTQCLRFRRAPTAPPLMIGQTINLALDMGIPDNLSLSGKSIHNKALIGVTDLFGGTSNISSSETALVTTTVDGSIVLGATKSAGGALDFPGQINWTLGYFNASGTDALNVSVIDHLPASLRYTGLATALPVGVTCSNGNAGDLNGDGITDCSIINTNADGSGGTLEFTIATLLKDDGNPAGGSDQGELGIWTESLSSTVTSNCLLVVPASGVAGNTCADGQLSGFTAIKSQVVANDRAGTAPPVYFGEEIRYLITVQNTAATARYLWLTDQLPVQTTYQPGSLRIDGAAASDSLINNGKLRYISTLALLPGSQITFEFLVNVSNNIAGSTVQNFAVAMFCDSRLDTDNCDGAQLTNTVYAEIAGSKISGTVFTDNGIGGGIAHNGSVDGTEAGLPEVTVRLTDAATGTLITSAKSDTAGSYDLYTNFNASAPLTVAVEVPNHWIPVSIAAGDTGAVPPQPTDTQLSFTPASSISSYQGLDFGLVQRPQLQENTQVTATPAQSLLIAHQYQITTAGRLEFDLSDALATTPLPGLQITIFHDHNCDATLDATDLEVNSISVTADSAASLCLLLSINTPDLLSTDIDLVLPIHADLQLSDDAATGHGVTERTTVIDTVRIILGEASRLDLTKSVQNISRDTPAATANLGLPGDVLQYNIGFQVLGAGPVTDVYINDSTPAYTRLNQPLRCPVSLSGCTVEIPASGQNNAGYSGQLQWRIGHELSAGSHGSLQFTVLID